MKRECKSSLLSEQNHYKTATLPKLLLKTSTSKTAKERKETNSGIWNFTLTVTKMREQTTIEAKYTFLSFFFLFRTRMKCPLLAPLKII